MSVGAVCQDGSGGAVAEELVDTLASQAGGTYVMFDDVCDVGAVFQGDSGRVVV